MRIWLVPTDELSDQHLLGQHRELHMLFAMITNPRFTNHRMVSFYRDKTSWLYRFHEELVRELDHRFNHSKKNGGHGTPAPDLGLVSRKWEPPEAWIEFDQVDLARRYQSETRFEYRWTRRMKPDWAENHRAIYANLGHIPAHLAGAQKLGVHP